MPKSAKYPKPPEPPESLKQPKPSSKTLPKAPKAPKSAQTKLTPRGQAALLDYNDKGYNDKSLMLTLSAPLSHPFHISNKWLEQHWEQTYIAYGRKFREKLHFSTVSTRGPTGLGAWSMHVIFQSPPAHPKWLEQHWRGYGADAVTSHHDNTLRYFIKNYMEPGALLTWGAWQQKKQAS